MLSALSLFFIVANTESLSVTLNEFNHVSIKGPITNLTASSFISNIEKLKTKHIYIYIDSTGGSVLDGEKIIQYIQFKKTNKHTILCIASHAYSMAFHIFQHCSTRFVIPTSVLMQHQMSLTISGQLKNIKNYISMIDSINTKYIEYESQKLGLTAADFNNKIDTDWWMYSNDIIKNNAADLMLESVGCDKSLFKNNFKLDVNSVIYTVSDCPLV